MRRLVLLALALSCGRGLDVPAQAQPPRVDSISPAKGFAGDTITITGANLADPSLQIFFDVRTAVIVTPPQQRTGNAIDVQVPQDVLGPAVTVTTSQGTAKAAQDFTYLGLGHPRNAALRATVSLKPNIALAFPLPGGEMTALLDWRYGMVIAQDSKGQLSLPSRVGQKPQFAFGPPEAAWVLDAPDIGPMKLYPVVMDSNEPEVGTPLPVAGSVLGMDANPSATRVAFPNGRSVNVYALPSGLGRKIDLPDATDDVVALRFAGDATIIGVTTNEPFRIDLGGVTPVISMGAPFDSASTAAQSFAAAAMAPALDRMAYATFTDVRFLTWGASGAPTLESLVISPHIGPHALSFDPDGAKLYVGDEILYQVAAADAVTGELLDAETVPGLGSLLAIPDGPNKGLLIAATGAGTSHLLPSGRLLRSDPVSLIIHSMAVDPVCGDVLLATAFGPLQVPSTTLLPLPIDSSLHLDGVQASEIGIAGWNGNELYVYKPPALCHGEGKFVHVATAEQPSIGAALSGDGKWIASGDGQSVELIPRSDNGAGLTGATVDYAVPTFMLLRYAGNSLTVAHHVPGGSEAVTTYEQATLKPVATLALDSGAVDLERIRFAGAWLIDEKTFVAGEFVSTAVTVWNEAKGTLFTGTVPAVFTVPVGLSADGFMLVGVSAVGSGIDTLILQVFGSRLVQEPGPHVDLIGAPQQVLSSPDGGRLYASLPDQNAIAIIE